MKQIWNSRCKLFVENHSSTALACLIISNLTQENSTLRVDHATLLGIISHQYHLAMEYNPWYQICPHYGHRLIRLFSSSVWLSCLSFPRNSLFCAKNSIFPCHIFNLSWSGTCVNYIVHVFLNWRSSLKKNLWVVEMVTVEKLRNRQENSLYHNSIVGTE